MTSSLHFPADFRFGAATASFQIEGAADADGKGESIWDRSCTVPGAVAQGHDGRRACEHYSRYRDDVALIKGLNLHTYRFSISWPRVMPDGVSLEPRGVAFYSRLVDELLAAGIEPWVTLYHWDLPQALEDQGGWRNRETASRFAEYARAMFDALGDRVKIWTTLNEPWCSAFLGHGNGEHAPGRRDPREAMQVAHHLNLAHGSAIRALRAAGCTQTSGHVVGLTINPTIFHPQDPHNPADLHAVERRDALRNRIWLDPVFRGSYPLSSFAERERRALEEAIQPGDLETIRQPIDVLGVNFYNGEQVRGVGGDPDARLDSAYPGTDDVETTSRNLPLTAMGWEVRADDLRLLLERLHHDYTGAAGTHLVITENGAAYDDVADAHGFVDDSSTRLAYIKSHLAATHAAMANGADVQGYLAWSLLDNFEWAWGYTRRFGIVRVDYATQQRVPKASARWFAEVARTSRIEP